MAGFERRKEKLRETLQRQNTRRADAYMSYLKSRAARGALDVHGTLSPGLALHR